MFLDIAWLPLNWNPKDGISYSHSCQQKQDMKLQHHDHDSLETKGLLISCLIQAWIIRTSLPDFSLF